MVESLTTPLSAQFGNPDLNSGPYSGEKVKGLSVRPGHRNLLCLAMANNYGSYLEAVYYVLMAIQQN